jgi:succinate dehydrogenase/fumarate reductase-like Fe-S protein
MMINGKPHMVCWEVLSPEQKEIILSPLKGRTVFKDLVVDLGASAWRDRRNHHIPEKGCETRVYPSLFQQFASKNQTLQFI